MTSATSSHAGCTQPPEDVRRSSGSQLTTCAQRSNTPISFVSDIEVYALATDYLDSEYLGCFTWWQRRFEPAPASTPTRACGARGREEPSNHATTGPARGLPSPSGRSLGRAAVRLVFLSPSLRTPGLAVTATYSEVRRRPRADIEIGLWDRWESGSSEVVTKRRRGAVPGLRPEPRYPPVTPLRARVWRSKDWSERPAPVRPVDLPLGGPQ